MGNFTSQVSIVSGVILPFNLQWCQRYFYHSSYSSDRGNLTIQLKVVVKGVSDNFANHCTVLSGVTLTLNLQCSGVWGNFTNYNCVTLK